MADASVERGEATILYYGQILQATGEDWRQVEISLSDDKGIVWPESVAPFRYHLVSLAQDDEAVKKMGDDLYESLTKNGIEVLYDERVGITAGEKFNDSDLIGIPTRIVVSKKTETQGKFEVKDRKTGEISMKSKEELLD